MCGGETGKANLDQIKGGLGLRWPWRWRSLIQQPWMDLFSKFFRTHFQKPGMTGHPKKKAIFLGPLKNIFRNINSSAHLKNDTFLHDCTAVANISGSQFVQISVWGRDVCVFSACGHNLEAKNPLSSPQAPQWRPCSWATGRVEREKADGL